MDVLSIIIFTTVFITVLVAIHIAKTSRNRSQHGEDTDLDTREVSSAE